MIISLSWLKEFLPELTWTADELADKATSIGHESTAVDAEHVEVEITPNRGDCLSVFGLARDLSGIYNLGLKQPELSEVPREKDIIALNIADGVADKVPQDYLVEIDGYHPQESPDEIKNKLDVLGLQSKDLIVDLTNVVSSEIGSPLHVFDYEKIKSGLEIGLSKKDEDITLLDGKTITLPAGCLVQRTEGKAVDLAGVMGGQASAVGEKTTHFVLQAAVFDVSLIRTTSKLSGVATSASLQYQKGVSSFAAEMGTRRFLYLLHKYAQNCQILGMQTVGEKKPNGTFIFDLEKIGSLIGTTFETDGLQNLTRLGFVVNGNQLTPPAWRNDVTNNAELAEELSRVVGLDKIAPQELSKTLNNPSNDFHRLTSLKQHMVALGLTETLGYSFVPSGQVEIANPFTEAMRFMRPSLLSSLLDTVARNPYMKKVLYFEVGHVFTDNETPMIGFASPSKNDSLMERLNTMTGTSLEWQEISGEPLSQKDIKFGKIYFAETPLMPILERTPIAQAVTKELPTYRPISKFPPTTRDVTLLVDRSIDPQAVCSVFLASDKVALAELTDSYQSESLGADKSALTFRILYQDLERSLTDTEVDELLKEHLNTLSKEVQFTLR